MTSRSASRWHPATRAVHGGTKRSQFAETSEAIFFNSGYVYENAEEAQAAFDNSRPRYVYGRYGNATVGMFEERMAMLEDAEQARATSTGMAAFFAALMCQLKAGDRVVAANALFSSCHYILTEILPRFGIETQLVDGRDLQQWEDALRRGARCVVIETPSNPTLRLVDIQAVSDLAHRVGAQVIVDNVFATPILQSPLRLGADVVFYSATKHIDGQGRALGGIVLGRRAFIEEVFQPFYRHTGPSLSPFNAWVMLKGLESMELRVHKASASAHRLAEMLARQEKVLAVHYPRLANFPQIELARRQMAAGGTMLSFEIEGGRSAAFRFLNALELILISNNLGDAKSLACHPATTTHQRLSPEDRRDQGITEGLIRLSVGIEDERDLLQDIAQALAQI
ncbi:MAG TPA: O-succinylhomoserine sulfhydrylase [Dongiaceae bacterium]|jgi:O-succinylhomoserine sulfhydrylase|nr:O-succinylhomoserine sulfhydrylase [Dongiaceae bacterium]